MNSIANVADDQTNNNVNETADHQSFLTDVTRKKISQLPRPAAATGTAVSSLDFPAFLWWRRT
jgi:hypothetical protein